MSKTEGFSMKFSVEDWNHIITALDNEAMGCRGVGFNDEARDVEKIRDRIMRKEARQTPVEIHFDEGSVAIYGPSGAQ